MDRYVNLNGHVFEILNTGISIAEKTNAFITFKIECIKWCI